MKNIRTTVLISLIFCFLMSSAAFADPCDSIGHNASWAADLKTAHEAMQAGDYEKALEISRTLYEICPRAPYLNYIIGKSLMETGESTKGVMYLQKASDYTSEFVVEPETQRIIWYERYEAEHPERKASALNALNEHSSKLQEENTKLLQEQIDLLDKDQRKNNIIMWTGVGIGGAGLLMTIFGAVFGFPDHENGTWYELVDKKSKPTYSECKTIDDNSTFNCEKDNNKYKINNSYVTGWAMFGAGLAMLAAGGAMTGIGAYYYVKNKKSEQPLDFSFSPTHINLSFTF